MNRRPPIKLKFWQDGIRLSKIASIAEKIFSNFEKPLKMLNKAVDIDKANIELVEIIGWGRCVDRIKNEDEALYRKRVKYALQNAQDAGCVNGFSEIWKRLGLGKLSQKERIEGQKYDIIELEIDDDVFWTYDYLLPSLIQNYGRTCRRYVLSTISEVDLKCAAINIDSESDYYEATFLGNNHFSQQHIAIANFNLLKNTYEAKF